MKNFLIIMVVMMTMVNIFAFMQLSQNHHQPPIVEEPVVEEDQFSIIEIPEKPEEYEITALPVEFINYQQICSLMKKWHQEAPEITDYGEYGQTSKGTPLTYLRIGTPGKPKVCIHAGIHGNERLSMAATMWIMQKMLHDYGRDKQVTWLVENRDVWWIPVLSPDTHLRSRHVEGRDPNRDYPYPGRRAHTPTSPVQGIMSLHEREDFLGVISGHTTGNVYFWPSIGPQNDQLIHRNLANEMSDRSGYSSSKISSRPSGYEIDWYYWKGAVSILTEFGSSRIGHNQPTSQIVPHGEKNYKAYMHFILKAPDLQEKLSPPSWRGYKNFDKPQIVKSEE